MLADKYLELLLSSGVLRFGSFTTKSGRVSPYFFNMGALDSGQRLAAAAELYADAIVERFGTGVDNLFGPAYKGIPLAVMSAAALAARLGRDVSFTFNRKEAKDHGEGGLLVGRQYPVAGAGGLRPRVVIVEDVITGGTSVNECMPLLRRYDVEVVGLLVGVDRQERGQGGQSAMAEVAGRWGLRTAAIMTMDEVINTLHGQPRLGQVWIDDALKERIAAYRQQYGA